MRVIYIFPYVSGDRKSDEITKKSKECSANVPYYSCDDLRCKKYCIFFRGATSHGKCISPKICHCEWPC